MPSVSENRDFWDSELGWPHAGDVWSSRWGSPRAQWYGTILPRIHEFLPAPAILEIATGMGRWTEFLLSSCDHLIGVDLAARCVEACRARFSSEENADFYQNDGRSLDMVEDRSIDFAFSFDSLVHVDLATLGSYAKELGRTLKPNGVAFIHHSNLGSYGPLKQFLAAARSRHLPQIRRTDPPDRQVAQPATDTDRTGNYNWRSSLSHSANWRDPGSSAEAFVASCQREGMHCISQELIPWDAGHYLIDCFSIITRAGSKWDGSLRVVRNPNFMDEARSIGNYSAAYERI